MWCKAFNYDYRCKPADDGPNGATNVEIFEVASGEVVLAYRLPYRRHAAADASATLMVIAEGPQSLAEMRAHHGFA